MQSDRIHTLRLTIPMGSSLGASLASQTQKVIHVGVACEITIPGSTHSPIPQHVHEAESTTSDVNSHACDTPSIVVSPQINNPYGLLINGFAITGAAIVPQLISKLESYWLG